MEWKKISYLILLGLLINTFFLGRVIGQDEDDGEGEEKEEEEGEIEGTEPDKYPTDNEVYVLGNSNFDEFIQVSCSSTGLVSAVRVVRSSGGGVVVERSRVE